MDLRFRGIRGEHEIKFNDSLGVYEVIEKSSGRVKGNSSDRLHASHLLYEFDGIFDSVVEPLQLCLNFK